MHKIIKQLKRNSLFFKITLIMVVSSITISVVTAFIVMQISKNTFINNFSITNRKVLNQIQTNYSDLNDKLINIMSNVNNSWAFRKYLTEKNSNIIDEFNLIYNLKQNLRINEPILDSGNIDLMLIGKNDTTYIRSSAILTDSVKDIKNDAITKNSLKNPDKILYQYNKSGFTNLSKDDNVIMVTKVLHDQTTMEQFGMLYITIKENVFSKLYSDFTTKGNDILLMSSDGTVVSSSIKDLIGKKYKYILGIANDIKRNNLKYKNVILSDKNYTVISNYMPIYDFYMINLVNTNLALKDIYNIKEIAFICSCIIIIAISILFIVIKKVTNPLNVLVNEMSKITEGDFKNHINLEGSYEIKKLSNSFNYMLDGLNDYVEKLLIAQQEKRKSELSALQMQINPHFMYNTLASIKYLIMIGNKEKAMSTINAFISLLQNTIGNTSELVTTQQEINNLKNYVSINHARYGNQIKVNYHVLPGCENYKIPKLILQPFVENAFFHAFAGDNEGCIHIFISKKKDNLFCEIIDNGIGMNKEQIKKLYSSNALNEKHFTGIGIKNVDDRIKLLYGDNFGVTITSKSGSGTTVSITLPLILSTPAIS